MTEPSKPPATHTLLGTSDAMVWAEEFCRIFRGWMIGPRQVADLSTLPTPLGVVDEGTMVGWFANAMQTALDQARIDYGPQFGEEEDG